MIKHAICKPCSLVNLYVVWYGLSETCETCETCDQASSWWDFWQRFAPFVTALTFWSSLQCKRKLFSQLKRSCLFMYLQLFRCLEITWSHCYFDLRNDLTSRHSDLRGSTPLLPWRPHRAWRKHEAQDPKGWSSHTQSKDAELHWMTDEWKIHISHRPSLLPSQDGKMTHIHCSEKGASLPPRWIVSVHLEIDPAMHVHVSHDVNWWNLT